MADSRKILHNTEDKRVLRQRMLADSTPRTTVSFYKYHQIPEPQVFRDGLFERWNELGVLGRTYIASEGINAQISVPTENFKAFVKDLFTIDFLNEVRLNTAVDEGKSFYALKVKLRNKIVADGIEDARFNPSDTGKYLNAEEWNHELNNPNTVVVDMRNHYESEVGHFEGAVCPDVDTFREELQVVEDILQNDKNKKVLMYCTGGIRCEKASAFMKHKGFENVYHLEGGIIKYARDAKANNLDVKFKGVNFVFDERLAERISDDIIASCHQCGEPFDHHTNCSNLGCHTLFIQCNTCKEKYENCCSEVCQNVIHLSEEEQKELRKNSPAIRNIYKKGRKLKLKK